MIELILPYPPTVNHFKSVGRLKTTRTGKMYQERLTSPETKRFYFEVFMKCRAQGVNSFDSATISLCVDVFPPDKRKRDLDNILKPTIDGLMKAGCFDDDSQIARLLVVRQNIIQGGQIIVRIEQI